MNNLKDLYRVVTDDRMLNGSQKNFAHGEYTFDVVFCDRDDFRLKATLWYNNIVIDGVYESRKYFVDAVAMSYVGERIGTVIFDIDIDKKMSYLELIEVNIPFRNRGIGKRLLEFMEYLSTTFEAKFVDGVYARSMCNYSQPFYESAGYTIYKSDTCEKVGRTLDQSKDFSKIVVGNIKSNNKSIVNRINEQDLQNIEM